MPSRAFTGIPLEAEQVALLDAARTVLLEAAPGWAGEKWVAAENLHVTLRFIGPLPDTDVETAIAALAEVGRRRTPFRLRLASLRARPTPRRAHMLWATLDDPDHACAALADDVGAALAAFGMEPDPRGFTPHVTLARTRRPRPLPGAALDAATSLLVAGKLEQRTVSVPAFTLYASTLTATGPVYEELASVALAGR